MKHLDDLRQPAKCRRLVNEIGKIATQPWTIMEVCGGQTHGLLRYGIATELAPDVQLIHGPGCPVCVTPIETIDLAVDLARRPNVLMTSFGDMLRVPGSSESLQQARAQGATVKMVYSPLDAVALARDSPDNEVVFLAVGFETTAPATALAVRQAAELGLKNFSLLIAHVCVLPAMEQLAASPDRTIQGFLAAGHVCAVTGYEYYQQLVDQYRLPVVVTGFEPVDLLMGILECVRCLEGGQPNLVNAYPRSVRSHGNEAATRLIDEVYQVEDCPWRGLGVIRRGGLRLRDGWRRFDAAAKFPSGQLPVLENDDCRSGDVLTGRIKPTECECFGVRCTPERPLGAPMVSGEGACAAYYRYTPPA